MHASTTDLDALLTAVRAGDPEAAVALVERLYPVVMAVAHRRRPATMEPEDMAQEVFAKIFVALPGFRGSAASLEAWARRIAFTTCLNQLRHEARRPELRWADLTEAETAALESLRHTEPSEEPAQRAAARGLVAQLLASLPAPDRVLLELIDLEQRPLEEVCRLTGWSRVNVRVRCFRARRRLRRVLKQLLRSHEPS